jgi:hypothetical protein
MPAELRQRFVGLAATIAGTADKRRLPRTPRPVPAGAELLAHTVSPHHGKNFVLLMMLASDREWIPMT